MTKSAAIAFFVSPHGFGHAARASAVMDAVLEINPSVRFEIITTVPKWFFAGSLSVSFGYHQFLTDIGMVQKSPLEEDLPETARRLDGFLPFRPDVVGELAGLLKKLGCELAICDISAIGIAAARKAGIPSVLIENFTWDWIYTRYENGDRILRHAKYLSEIYASASRHIQTEPICSPENADLTAPPIARRVRKSGRAVRNELEIPANRKMVLITMGGIRAEFRHLGALAGHDSAHFVIPGTKNSGRSGQLPDNITLLSENSDFFHPDLVNASDAVIGKAGYSTLAEIRQAGVPFGCFLRPVFPEAAAMAGYIEKHIPGMRFDASAFENGSWIPHLSEILSHPRQMPDKQDGASMAAAFILNIL